MHPKKNQVWVNFSKGNSLTLIEKKSIFCFAKNKINLKAFYISENSRKIDHLWEVMFQMKFYFFSNGLGFYFKLINMVLPHLNSFHSFE